MKEHARHAVERVERAVEAIRAGRMVILTDDEDRENEGDLTMAAEIPVVTPSRASTATVNAVCRGVSFLAAIRSRPS